jgi:hypothetical protein
MQTANILQAALPPDRINQVHAAATGKHEDVPDAAIYQKLRDVIRNLNHNCSLSP